MKFLAKFFVCVSVLSLATTTVNAAQAEDVTKQPLPGEWPKIDLPPKIAPEWRNLLKNRNSKALKIPQKRAFGDPTACKSTNAEEDAKLHCDWTCSQCTRPNDHVTCKSKTDWGITYDDGPAPYTVELLDFLRETDVKVTFFVVGSRVYEFPHIAKQIVEEGHEIAIHAWSHSPMTTQSTDTVVAEIKWTERAIKMATGVTPRYCRPPYGDMDDRVREILKELGCTPVLWNRDSFDYTAESNATFDIETVPGTFEQWLEQPPNGDISLEHDLYQQAAAIAPYVVETVQKGGRRIAPVSVCLGGPAYKESGPSKKVIASGKYDPSAYENLNLGDYGLDDWKASKAAGNNGNGTNTGTGSYPVGDGDATAASAGSGGEDTNGDGTIDSKDDVGGPNGNSAAALSQNAVKSLFMLIALSIPMLFM